MKFFIYGYRSIIPIFILFLLIFDLSIPPFRKLGSAWIALLIITLLISYNQIEIKKYIYKYRYLFLLYIFSLCYSIFIILINGAEEPSYIWSFLKSSVVMLGSVLFIANYNERDISKLVLITFIINSLICLIVGSNEYLLPYIQYFKYSGKEMADYILYRVSSLSGSGYFGISAPYTLMIAFFGFYISKLDKLSPLWLLSFISLCLAGVLSGRTAFIGIAFSVLIIVIFNFKRSIPILCLILITIAFVYMSEYFILYRDWLFRFFIEIMPSSGVESSALSFVDGMLFTPGFGTILLGDGHYVTPDGRYYGHTDLGYMRFLLFGGIPFTFLSLFFVFVLSLISRDVIYFFIIGLIIFILHFKGVVIFNNAAVTSTAILLSYKFYYKKGVNDE